MTRLTAGELARLRKKHDGIDQAALPFESDPTQGGVTSP